MIDINRLTNQVEEMRSFYNKDRMIEIIKEWISEIKSPIILKNTQKPFSMVLEDGTIGTRNKENIKLESLSINELIYIYQEIKEVLLEAIK